MTKKYKITLSADQLMTLLKALELKGRIGIGQFNEIGWQISDTMNHPPRVEAMMTALAAHFGVANMGMGNQKVHPEVQRCWDIFQVLRQKYAKDNFDNKGWSVWLSDPLYRSDVRLDPPLIEAVNEPLLVQQESLVVVSGSVGKVKENRLQPGLTGQSSAKTSRASVRPSRKDRDPPQKKSRDILHGRKSKKSPQAKARAAK